MRFMERNCLSEIPLAPPENLGCANELTWSNLDALALTAENCQDVLRSSANATPFAVLRSGYCQKIDSERDEALSHTYADSNNPLTGHWVDNYRCIRAHCLPPSADMQEFLKLYRTKKPMNGKGIVSRGLATCSKQFSASNPYKDNTIQETS